MMVVAMVCHSKKENRSLRTEAVWPVVIIKRCLLAHLVNSNPICLITSCKWAEGEKKTVTDSRGIASLYVLPIQHAQSSRVCNANAAERPPTAHRGSETFLYLTSYQFTLRDAVNKHTNLCFLAFDKFIFEHSTDDLHLYQEEQNDSWLPNLYMFIWEHLYF